MGKELRVGILYENNEHWIGGTYYIQNLIAALNKMRDNEKPTVVVFAKTEQEFTQIEQTGYPHLEFKLLNYQSVRLSLGKRILNKLNFTLFKKDLFPQPVAFDFYQVNVMFPTPVGMIAPGMKKIYWIPDFQELYYPEFFSKSELSNRMQNHSFIASSKDTVVFSSNNALNDFKKLFPSHHCKTAVVQFAVTHPDLNELSISDLKEKFGIGNQYIIAPNQFWVHKNQSLIVEAARILMEKGQLDFQIVFTGKEHDPRNPDYASDLKKRVKELGLSNQILFLGFIDRNEQLCLVKNADAVIQPSLFEGWSTVVEDAKALNKYVLASDLAVHREQLPHNASFFEINNSKLLADLLSAKQFTVDPLDYNNNIEHYAQQFKDLIY